MTDKLHTNPVIVAHAGRVLAELMDSCRSLNFATILSEDGFEVTNLGEVEGATNRIAAMVSSMQALSDAIVRDLKMGTSEYVIVAAPDGYVIQLKVPGQPLVLASYFDAGETVGKALSVSRLAAASMGSFDLSEAA